MTRTIETANRCIDIVYSPDEDCWYALEYDFARKAQRVSARVYRSELTLMSALDSGRHRFENWPAEAVSIKDPALATHPIAKNNAASWPTGPRRRKRKTGVRS